MSTKQERLTALVNLYNEQKPDIQRWLNQVRTCLYGMMEERGARIHFIRWRMKDPVHLENKLDRKWDDYKDYLTEENFFYKLTDLAGVRILVLYREDLPVVDEQLWDCDYWTIYECKAYYDSGRHSDRQWLIEHGFHDPAECSSEEEENPSGVVQPTVEAKEHGYSSIHYILQQPTAAEPLFCELQLRTIHQEAWGEFDHELKYPHGQIDPLAGHLIAKLSSLLHVAEDIVSDIRRHPASGLLVQRLYSEALRHGRVSDANALTALRKDVIPQIPYLYKAAPIAALTLLQADEEEHAAPKSEIISLDFGESDSWDENDPLRVLYLTAHRDWRREDRKRRVRKYFVWSGFPSERNTLLELFQHDLDLVIFPAFVFRQFHEELRCLQFEPCLGMTRGVELRLERVQFFLWDLEDPKTAKLGRTNIYGFYSPAKTTDLTSGIVNLTNRNGKRFRFLEGYTKALSKLVDANMALSLDVPPPRWVEKEELPAGATATLKNVASEFIQELNDG